MNKLLSLPLNKILNFRKSNTKIPYQSVWFKGSYYPGLLKTRRIFYSFDILRELSGKSFVDLGCNRGGIVFLAEENGASPTIGIDLKQERIKEARKIAKNENASSQFINANILDYIETMNPVDFVCCTAVFRHIYGQLMSKFDPSFVVPKQYLVYKSMDVLIRQNVGDPREVTQAFNDILRKMLNKTKSRFICSFNDNSGLIARRPYEVDKFFKSLHSRVDTTETYISDFTMPKYVVINIKMKPLESGNN